MTCSARQRRDVRAGILSRSKRCCQSRGKIDNAFVVQPLVEAAVRHTMGDRLTLCWGSLDALNDILLAPGNYAANGSVQADRHPGDNASLPTCYWSKGNSKKVRARCMRTYYNFDERWVRTTPIRWMPRTAWRMRWSNFAALRREAMMRSLLETLHRRSARASPIAEHDAQSRCCSATRGKTTSQQIYEDVVELKRGATWFRAPGHIEVHAQSRPHDGPAGKSSRGV